MANVRKLYLIPSELALGMGSETLPKHTICGIKSLRYFFVENVKTTRRFISSLKLDKKIEDLFFFEITESITDKDMADFISTIPSGENIGLLSDCGNPCIADPGAKVVSYAHRHDIQVIPLVGPSSILLTLIASGFNGQNFAFHGYVPIEKVALVEFLKKIENESQRENKTQLFMDTPYRNNRLLETILTVCRSQTKLCIAANLTAENEYVRSLSIHEWKKNLPSLHKQPVMYALYAATL
ncbi:MAG: SAM-dependent methyltransferase [Cytophagaceae bacterium]|nr:SAM-dependent methyltransferase [Cytophagaceae bacterium]MDW8455272.1 SAM-dependent methyltransferase [Cytophagaceae bacterium]